MTRRRRSRDARPGPAGFLVVDKPAGWTSHDVVDAARRWLGTRRVGHLGTLDPQATGVLPLAVREATKLAPFFEEADKRYQGTVRLGVETDTLDAEGEVLRRHGGPLPGREEVAEALAAFRGDVEQIPPMFSAVKRQGVPLHRLARRGEFVERPPKKVRIHHLELVDYRPSPQVTDVDIEVECSAGTYVRTLAADLGRRLGCGAHLAGLRRVRSGGFDESMARPVEALEAAAETGDIDAWVLPPERVLEMPTWVLPLTAARRVAHGGDVPAGTVVRAAPGARIAALDDEGRLVAILEMRADRRLVPIRVLRPAD